MDIKLHKIKTNFDGEYCYVAPRGAVLPNGDVFVETSPLLLSGVDTVYGTETFIADGKTFEPSPFPFKKHKTLQRQKLPDGREMIPCDFMPIYHKKTGKLLMYGHNTYYHNNDEVYLQAQARQTTYTVYDEKTGTFPAVSYLEMDEEEFFNFGSGSGQCVEEDNGDLILPVYGFSKAEMLAGKHNTWVAVLRCSFDGKTLRTKEIGKKLVLEQARGFCEPSVTKYNGEYFICLRSDDDGFLAKSKDGLHYDEPKPLCFEDGASVGNYNTQQHWLVGGGKLWLVYTRRGEDNAHVFRHRAPLFIAEVDPVSLRVIRATEKIVVPNRGARLGNFGCCNIDDKRGIVVASEWMQFGGGANDIGAWKKCMEYGSDNSIFIAEILF